LAGVSPDTIRHYERLGILPEAPRTESGYRLYSASTVERVRLVQHALQLGFSLHELSDVLKERDGGGTPCRRVLQITEEKLRALSEQIAELKKTESYMQGLVDEWRARLAKTQPGSKALLLSSLTENPAAKNGPSKTFTRRKK
jgi:DNA-binding transcriptional MerR regulator